MNKKSKYSEESPVSDIDQMWVDLKDVAPLFGMSYASIKNAISLNRFPLHSYKLGRRRVVDKQALTEFFTKKNIEAQEQFAQTRPKPRPPKKRPHDAGV